MDENYYMEAAMKDPSPTELDPHTAEYQTQARAAVVAAARQVEIEPKGPLAQAVAQATSDSKWFPLQDTDQPPGSDEHDLNTRVVGQWFFPTARDQGIALMELCGGIAAGLEAVIRAGIRINCYKYVDIDPTARKIVRFKLTNLSARFPELLPITA